MKRRRGKCTEKPFVDGMVSILAGRVLGTAGSCLFFLEQETSWEKTLRPRANSPGARRSHALAVLEGHL
ncbi:MAG: hypothetical protein Q4D16_21535 [Eubacteriales bacterium]|nr:hypothetical protein [Eubacteriales bacterium]